MATSKDHDALIEGQSANPTFTTAIPARLDRSRHSVQDGYRAACERAAEALIHAPSAHQALQAFFDAYRDSLATRMLDSATDDATAMTLRRHAMALAQAASDLGLRPLDAAVQTGHLSRAARVPDNAHPARSWDY